MKRALAVAAVVLTACTGGSGNGGGMGGEGGTGGMGGMGGAGGGMSNKTPGTLWAIYMVGSDLEDDTSPRDGTADEQQGDGGVVRAGNGGDDFREMVSAWKALSADEKKNLEVVVAFGGARKQGWQGVKYADMACLEQDAADDYFGNDTCYLQKDAALRMGKEATFKAFLDFIKPRSDAREKTYVDVWDHGGAYSGIGPDHNGANEDEKILLPKEIASAFAASGLKVDLIGFDACLMGSLEVAVIIKDTAHYLVGSEETEPGHGWDYKTIFTFLGKTPGATPVEIGKKVVDAFIDGSSIAYDEEKMMPGVTQHSVNKGKTLALIDLTKVPDVVGKLDAVIAPLAASGNAESFVTAQVALSSTEDYEGVHGDAKHFAVNLKRIRPASAAAADELITAITAAVVAARNDGARPQANGLAIFLPRTTQATGDYKKVDYISAGWKDFIGRFYAIADGDMQRPTVVSDVNGAQAGERKMVFSDNVGLDQLDIVYARDTATAKVFDIVGKRNVAHETFQVSDAGTVEYPVTVNAWDQKWYRLCSGDCGTGMSVTAHATFDEKAQNGDEIFKADIDWTEEGGKKAVSAYLYFEVDNNDAVVDAWLKTYTDDNGEITIEKDSNKLQKGDTVKFFFDRINNNTDMTSRANTAALVLDADPKWTYDVVPGTAEKFWFVRAADAKGNVEESQEYKVP